MAQQTDKNDKSLTYWGGLDFTNKNANNIKSDSTQLSGTILASESLGVDNLVNKQQTAIEWFVEQLPIRIVNSYQEEIAKAKQMEKEQIIDAFGVGCQVESTRLIGYQGMSEQYYKDNYEQ